MPRAVGLLLLAAACASYPSGPVTGGPPCNSDNECPMGQTCRQHNCFAGVPDVEFAAELFAPAGRTDMLARAEVDPLTISSTGQVEVMFAKSIEISGRVLLRSADPTAPSVAAKVSFHRPSRIPGAPDYVVTVDAAAGKLPGQVAFTVRLAPNINDVETYDVTIFPDDGSLDAPAPGTLAPNALAPPLTLSGFHLKANFFYDFTCDSGGLRTVAGNIVDAAGNGLGGMVVRAYSPLSQSTNNDTQLVSSTAVTGDDGHYVLYLPKAKAQLFDLHVASSSNRSAPSLLRRDVLPVMAARDAAAIYIAGVVDYPPFPALVSYTLPVLAMDPTNPSRTVPAFGAVVQLSTTVSASGSDLVSFETDATVGADGIATATLIPGTALVPRAYTVTVLPPPTSSGQSVWDRSITVGEAGALDGIVLDPRTHVVGRVVDSQGKPVPNMTVQPQLAPVFTANLKVDALNRLTTLSLPQAATDDKGAFGLYLDPKLLAHDATYDLELVPPSGSILPRWSRDAVAITAANADLGDVKLPAATLASGVVRDENGAPVADAEVRVYMRTDDTTRLRTLTKSDKDGTISLVLPSP